ncbi:hypothetical protein [Sphingomonas sp. FARSPH]|uniref:hypothetical protein n=1 Tax=Sphingomonas sp. FARSPH TaxID=2219696 RepID=UPI000F73B4B1|nr:hypothetical protein [Sphingomonas sp. FARSPH]
MKGSTDRIAIIHAIYGAACAAMVYAELHRPVALILLGASLFALIASTVSFDGRGGAGRNDPDVSAGIIRINVATGVAVVAAIVIAHGMRADRYLVAVVLVVMAVHFLPLWKLLGRSSLAVMGAALAASAVLVFLNIPSDVAPMLASLIFSANSGRLAARQRAHRPS